MSASEQPPAKPVTSQDAENLRFLYDKRLTLFNTRREHEWKIYFGAMALLGAADATLVSGTLIVVGRQRWMWALACAVIFGVVFGYERALQMRNKGDREAMDDLYDHICDLLGIVLNSPIRAHKSPIRPPTRMASLWSRYGWAFPWQMILLFVVAASSAYLPFR
jgi:hypothetical protein